MKRIRENSHFSRVFEPGRVCDRAHGRAHFEDFSHLCPYPCESVFIRVSMFVKGF